MKQQTKQPDHKTEKKLDWELKNTFPASDPPSGNVFVGAPSDDERQHADNCSCGSTHKKDK